MCRIPFETNAVFHLRPDLSGEAAWGNEVSRKYVPR